LARSVDGAFGRAHAGFDDDEGLFLWAGRTVGRIYARVLSLVRGGFIEVRGDSLCLPLDGFLVAESGPEDFDAGLFLRIGRAVRRACGRVLGLVEEGFMDARRDGSCPALKFLLEESGSDFDEGLFLRIGRAAELAGYRLRVTSAAAIKRRTAGCRDPLYVSELKRVPLGLTMHDRKEILVQAHRRPSVRLRVAMHEFAHLADLVALAGFAAQGAASLVRSWWGEKVEPPDPAEGRAKGAAERLERFQRRVWDAELAVDFAAAVLADIHGLGLYEYVCSFLTMAWRAYWDIFADDPALAELVVTRQFRERRVGPASKPEPWGWLMERLERISPRAVFAAVFGEGMLAQAAGGAGTGEACRTV